MDVFFEIMGMLLEFVWDVALLLAALWLILVILAQFRSDDDGSV